MSSLTLDGLGPVRQTGGAATRTKSTYSVVSNAVKAEGLLSRTPWFYGLLLTGLSLAMVGLGIGFWLLGDSWFQLLIAAALGLLLTQFAFVAHEASHRQVRSFGPANDRLGRFLASGVVGMSYTWWMTKHTRHHANPNRVGSDPDIAWDTISFLPEDAAKQRGLLALITRKQGYLFFPLLTLEGLNLHFQSLRLLLSKEQITGRWIELGLIVSRLSIYVAILFTFLPVGMGFAFLGVQLAVFGIYMGASFAPNHKGMPIVGADERLDFLTKQVRTSRNIRGGWWATALYGGLNYQVEHHLFPSMARPQLARASALVKAHCRTEGIPYTEANLFESYGIVIAYLNRVGLSARDPFDCPMVNEFRRR